MRTMKLISRIGVAFGALLAGALPASAQTSYPPPSSVAPTIVTQGGGGGGAPAAAEAASGGLAFTGAEIGLLVLAVAILVGVGAAALILARRRGTQAA